jgi:plasmid rolling circle replication initiator protein Rep
MKKNQVLNDTRKNGKVNDWRSKKVMNIEYADLLKELRYKKADNVRSCGEVLKFKKREDGSLKLEQAWFCKSRLCPMCNWRRSIKHSRQVIKIVDEAVKKYPKGRFLFWTLTTKNVFTGDGLKDELSRMNTAFNSMLKYKKVSKNLLGYLKATEVTVNKKDGSYNQHLHILVFVKSTYFSGKLNNYISQAELTEFWKKALKIDYTPIVNTKAVKPKATEKEKGVIGAVYETAKYPVKSIDYLTDNHEENLQRVDDLEKGLKRKRLISFGGIFKEIRKELQLDDVETGDLIKTSSEEDEELTIGQVIVARWNWERKNYFID